MQKLSKNLRGYFLGYFAQKYGYQFLLVDSDIQSERSKISLIGFMRHSDSGGDGVIILDRPRGPRFTVKPGTRFMAEQSIISLCLNHLSQSCKIILALG